jgi:hypothetical protein
MKPCALLIPLLFLTSFAQAKFTFTRHYEATRMLLKENVTTFTEDTALVLAASTWEGMEGDQSLCGTMIAICIMEGALTVKYDKVQYYGFLACRESTALVSAKWFSDEKKPREEWINTLKENPGYQTFLACQQFRHLKKTWKTTNNTVRVWLAGPEFKTNRSEWDRSLKYLAGVLQFRDKYEAKLKALEKKK